MRNIKVEKKLSRAEKNAQTRAKLIAAAAKVIGKWGYAEASVARITAQARVAHGTFYSHFREREEIFDLVLPTLGSEMLDYISSRDDSSLPPIERDVIRFKSFFEFLIKSPEFLRIYYEAEFFAAEANRRHIQNIHDLYTSTLKRTMPKIAMHYSDEELDIIADILLGARRKLIPRIYTGTGKLLPLSDAAISAYRKLVQGLFSACVAERHEPA